MNSGSTGAGAQGLLPRRQRLHTRSIVIEAFERDDGLFDLDAHLTDIKDRDADLASGVRRAGVPIHDMSLRLTINRNLDIVAIDTNFSAIPYPDACGTAGPAYRSLIGLNLLSNFKREMMTVLGGTRGCTHMSELAAVLPTAAVQAFAGAVGESAGGKPFELDRCHALETSTATVKKYYPVWHVGDALRRANDEVS